jgi:hypothetical protein
MHHLLQILIRPMFTIQVPEPQIIFIEYLPLYVILLDEGLHFCLCDLGLLALRLVKPNLTSFRRFPIKHKIESPSPWFFIRLIHSLSLSKESLEL